MNEGEQLPYLATFCEAAESGSFTAAAHTLGVTQAAISQRVQALEQSLGKSVFHRSGGRVTLTEVGQKLHDYAQRILSLHQSAHREISGREVPVFQDLLLAASSVPGECVLPEMLNAFSRKHPQVRVRATVTDSAEAIARVDRGDVHLGLVGWRGESLNLECRPFGHDNLVLVVPSAHRLAKRKTVRVDQFAAEPFILRENGSGQRQSLEESLIRSGKSLGELRVVLELGSNEAIKEAILRGLGVAVLSTIVIERELRTGRLRALRIKDIHCQRDLFIVRSRKRLLPLPARLFLDHVSAAHPPNESLSHADS